MKITVRVTVRVTVTVTVRHASLDLGSRYPPAIPDSRPWSAVYRKMNQARFLELGATWLAPHAGDYTGSATPAGPPAAASGGCAVA